MKTNSPKVVRNIESNGFISMLADIISGGGHESTNEEENERSSRSADNISTSSSEDE